MLTNPSALFPGAQIYLYVPMGAPAASYSLPWCPTDGTISYDLVNPAPGAPSLSLMRENITQRTVVQYVVEHVDVAAVETQGIMLGLFSLNGSGVSARGMYMRRDAAGRYQLVYIVGGNASEVAWDLGSPQLPFRVRAEVQPKSMPQKMEWLVTVADRQQARTNTISYEVPSAAQTLMFGVSLQTSGARARATFSDVQIALQ